MKTNATPETIFQNLKVAAWFIFPSFHLHPLRTTTPTTPSLNYSINKLRENVSNPEEHKVLNILTTNLASNLISSCLHAQSWADPKGPPRSPVGRAKIRAPVIESKKLLARKVQARVFQNHGSPKARTASSGMIWTHYRLQVTFQSTLCTCAK